MDSTHGCCSPELVPKRKWDFSSHDSFYDYYAKASQSKKTLDRFRAVQAAVLRIVQQGRFAGQALNVADIGCGAGTQCMMWAESGHCAFGVDVNEPLIKLARKRAQESRLHIDFSVGSAVELPWPDQAMHVCLLPEVLEHVREWRLCLTEAARILQPGGVLFVSTTNKLCPSQQEFNLPLYSWYPSSLKRHFERLAVTKRPELANFATYPAVNWFSFYGLRSELRRLGLDSCDRFDVMDLSVKGVLARLAVSCIRSFSIARWLAHAATPSTTLFAVKK
jgi:2-polyprenyl-6-hydroxyphenyl methylase/3-demethylubiquinone-9 3-methyltransferase